jgi:hypothetical protein
MTRFIGALLLICLFMGAAKMAIALLAVAFIFCLLWGALFRPAQAFGFIAFLVLAKLAETYPVTLLAILAIGAINLGRDKNHSDEK